MEPLNCVIEPTANGVRMYDGCQIRPRRSLPCRQVLGLEQPQVEVKTVYGGRLVRPARDATIGLPGEAAHAFALLGGKTPVKLVWDREDDIRGGYYRADGVASGPCRSRVRTVISSAGITAWSRGRS